MQYYRLMIEKGGEWHTVDLSLDTAPGMTYQVNDVAELEDRNADYSQSITLPMTPANARIFGYPNAPYASPDEVYDYFPCRLFYGASPLAGRGALLAVLRVTGDGLEVQITAGLADAVEALEAVSLEEVDDSSIRPTLPINSKEIIQPMPSPDVEFPAMLVGNGWIGNLDIDPATNAYRLSMPAVRLWTREGGTDYGLLPFLAAQAGYTLDSPDLGALSLGLITPIDRSAPAELVADKVLTQMDFRFTGYPGGNPPVSGWTRVDLAPHFDINGILGNRDDVHYIDHPDEDTWFITKQTETNITIDLSLTITDDADISVATCECAYYLNGERHKVPLSFYGSRTFTTQILLSDYKPKDTLHFYFYFAYPANSLPEAEILRSGQILITKTTRPDLDYAIPGLPMPICQNLGWDTAADAFKAVIQAYGLVVTVDNLNKVIHLTRMIEVESNKSKARDWSGKLTRGNMEREYRIGDYVQRNTISFKEDRDKWQDTGVITCGNRTLDREKQLFEIDIESGRNEEYADTSGIIATYGLVPYFVRDDDGSVSFEKLSAPHLGISGIGFQHITMQSLIGSHYRAVQNMLTRPLTVRADFLLTDLDVADFDHFTPVYLRQFGAYFYVNKISNFVAGEVTEVELIKINTNNT